LSSPAKPEDANNQTGTRKHRAVQSFLGRRETFPFFDEAWVVQREQHVKEGTNSSTDTDPNKYETILCDRKMALLDENQRERFKD
jgi:hypothetical protein